mgnify:CR=1 FL=1
MPGGRAHHAPVQHVAAAAVGQRHQRALAAGVAQGEILEDAAVAAGAPYIEIHTGKYAETKDATVQAAELKRISEAAAYSASLGLVVNAGHGLHYHNVQAIAAIPQMYELNIGHAIVARAVFSGLDAAVREMKRLMSEARR